MFKKYSIFTLLVSIIFTLSIFLMSCVTVKYNYKGAAYDTVDKAIAGHRADLDNLLSKIQPTDNPIGGSIVFIIPSEMVIENKIIKKEGIKGKISKEQLESLRWMVTYVKNDISLLAEAAKANNMFDTISIVSSNTPGKEDFTQDYSLYLYVGEKGATQWMFKKKGDTEGVPVHFNNTLKDEQRVLSIFNDVRKVLKDK